ncbi:MAG: transglutaminase domain-containing protein [Actinomycetia bacterium]|nr:transglutaminase domain-containing protein [Actinomycetes bacterium]
MSPRSPASALPPTAGGWYWGAELSCLLPGLALAVSTVRLFSSPAPTLTLVAVATLAWALALVLRLSPLSGGASEVAHLLLGFALLAWVVAPAARFGPLPTPASLTELAELVRSDFAVFDQDMAPLDPRAGHMAVLAALVWVLALFCSSTAMRVRSPVQAVLPHVVAILALGFVARDQARPATAAVLLVAIGGYALAQAAWRNAAFRWQPHGTHGITRPLAAGLAIIIGALAVTSAITPLSPVQNDPVVDLRRGGLGDGGPRTVVSPFVEVGSNLSSRSNDLLFTVRTDTPDYWRLTSLEEYDPEAGIWVLANSYEPVRGGELAPGAEADAAVADAEMSIRSLGGIWIPSPPDPLTVRSDIELNWDRASGSLISRSGDVATGDELRFEAETPALDPATLGGRQPGAATPRLLDASGTPTTLAAEAQLQTSGLDTYESALALQNWFRSEFTYDETVDYSTSRDPLAAFLDLRRGFCQQFATAFTLAARSLGIPARVVVGFTPGNPVQGDPTELAVYGRQAHAWPEVLIDGVGWVSFEPTPGRGNPATTQVTGVPPAQAAPPEGSEQSIDQPDDSTTTTEATQPESAGEANPDQGVGDNTEQVNAGGAEQQESAGPWRWILPLLAVGVLGAAAVVLIRRRGPGDPPRREQDPVSTAWYRACALLERAGSPIGAAETPNEYAHRVNQARALGALVVLAQLESARRWSSRPPGAVDSETAQLALVELAAQLDTALDLERATETASS